MITLCGEPVRHEAHVVTTVDDPVVVQGPWLERVSSGGHRWIRQVDQWFPPGRIRHILEQSSGDTTIQIMDRDGNTLRVVLERRPVKLTPEELQALRDDLGELALSFQDESVVADVAVAGMAGRSTRRSEAAWWVLYEVLARCLPPLLRSPLRVQRLAVGPTPLHRAGLSPSTILARTIRDERTLVMAFRREEGESASDYRWLAGVVDGVLAFARRQVRGWRQLAFEGDDPVTARWQKAVQALEVWTRHPTLRGRLSGPSQPTWTLSRHPDGAQIVRASAASQFATRLARGVSGHDVSTRRLMRAPVAEDAHLYELWVLLRVVEVLRDNFGFRFVDGEPQQFHDYGTYDERQAKWMLKPMKLIRRCLDFEERELVVEATVSHEPELRTSAGKVRTPDVVLDVTARGRTTRHGLDAKFIKGNPLSAARQVAYAHYLHDTELFSCFLAIPSARAELDQLVTQLDRLHGERVYPRSTQSLYAVPSDPRYGLAWGTVACGPGDEMSGVRQFVTLALQYHRTELRHVCGQCGTALTYGDTHGAHTRADAFGAHSDSPMGRHEVSPVLLEYHCPTCKYTWSRHRCYHGHVLMKHGRLTPHRQIDGDHNVACSVCGHRRG